MVTDTNKEVLSLSGDGTQYEVESVRNFPDTYDLLFKAQVKGKIEEIKLNINTKP